MIARGLEHPALQAIGTDEVREEHVREPERERGVDDDEGDPPHVEARQRVPLRAGAEEAALERAEHEFEVHGLRTGPPAPDAPEQRGDEEHGQHDRQPEQHQRRPVGGPEHGAERGQLARAEVDQQGGPPVDPDPRQRDEQRDQRVRHHPTPLQEAALRDARPEPASRAVLVHRGQHAHGGALRHGANASTGSPWRGLPPGAFVPRSVVT